jgi:chemotaxis methyl-accepting protein methylase
VLASDVDAQALAIAEAAVYPAAAAVEAIREVCPEAPHGRVEEGRFAIVPRLRAVVRFRRDDLTAPVAASGPHDVICCRNVLIFLGREGQRRVLEAAAQALRPGGLLVLGRTESLMALPGADLAPLDITHRIYRKAP